MEDLNVNKEKNSSSDRARKAVEAPDLVAGFDDLLPLTAVRTAPGEYDIMSSNGRRLWFMEGASLADWVCASVNGYDGALRGMRDSERDNAVGEAVRQVKADCAEMHSRDSQIIAELTDALSERSIAAHVAWGHTEAWADCTLAVCDEMREYERRNMNQDLNVNQSQEPSLPNLDETKPAYGKAKG